jgi:hypothetical protein
MTTDFFKMIKTKNTGRNRCPQIIFDETRLSQICDDLSHLQMICGHLFENYELQIILSFFNSFILSVVIRNICIICVLAFLN